jgi:hypothetical protein
MAVCGNAYVRAPVAGLERGVGLGNCRTRSEGENAPGKDSGYFRESGSLVAALPQALGAGRSIPSKCLASLARSYRGICRFDASAQRPSHSFGSYHFAQHRNENLTAAEMGNSPAMIFQHYRAVVTPEAAARFWSHVPSPRSNVIDFAA